MQRQRAKRLTTEPSTTRERQAVGRLLEKMTPRQRTEAVNRCCKLAVTPEVLQQVSTDGSARTAWCDLCLLVVDFGVSWDKVQEIVEDVFKQGLSGVSLKRGYT